MLDLNSLEGCYAFANNETPETVARQILRDQQVCRCGGVPSLVVHCLPPRTDLIARAISDTPDIPLAVSRMRLASIISIIKTHLATLSRSSSPSGRIPKHLIPSDWDYKAALKVLQYLQLPQVAICASPATPLSTVLESIQTQLSHGPDLRESLGQRQKRNKYCYICRFITTFPHRLYPSLCNPCGEFNIASSSLSLPSNLVLFGKTALVTGGRINLGYHTALRLLRCGARVVVSTRYPLDAEARFVNEGDFLDWKDRLKVVGADFRSAKDVFELINAVLKCLKDWNPRGPAKLDILINNAAQTLTDSVEKEGESVDREQHLRNGSAQTLLVEGGYTPRVRGGIVGYLLESGPTTSPPPGSSIPSQSSTEDTKSLIKSTHASSSWVQGISDIPYEDVISAHSVNAFVPFILLRELMPYMGSRRTPSESPQPPSAGTTTTNPSGYIVNVSSREGLIETKPASGAKDGHHVHTNMSKAALNMLTETEAEKAWRNGRVAMNTVDPGYMSADPVFMEMVGRVDEACPISWEDGAGRVLWPIARGEQGDIIRGRFLKHFTVVEAVR